MSADRCTVLVVDDEAYILPTLRALLIPEFHVLLASGADEAEKVFHSHPVDILLTDQKMPRRTGIELLQWAREHFPRTIRLLMTGYSELEDAVEAINRGSVYYYLMKPWRTEDLLQILRNAADKFQLERKREQLLEQLQQLNRELETRVADRTRQLQEANHLLEQRARELERLALTDPLTGLFNRRAMDELGSFERKRQSRFPGCLAVGFLDVDHFKEVNTSFLHTGGDEVLKNIARLLSSTIREVDSVARVGGEEFLILARDTNAAGAQVLAERIRSTIQNTPIRYNGHEIRITVSIGFAVAEAGSNSEYAAMHEAAAAALKQAKTAGRNRCVVHTMS
jgi:diguanylate cyclase (GGDEF)-like protein